MVTTNHQLSYGNIFAIGIFHLGAILALFHYESRWLWLAPIIWMISHGIGLAVGFHRLLTHRGFKTPKWVEYVITLCGALALQGGHIKWVAIHREHHRFTEQIEDPHSPRNGFFHSHIGWMLYPNPEFATPKFLKQYAKDLTNDRFHVFLNRWWWLPSMVLASGLFYFGGLPAVLWGIFIPVAVGLQFTWLVNSACHLWGSRMFETNDDSKNNWLVAWVTWGEGWHNNHHNQPTRARHGIKWYQFDFGWYFILILSFLRLAKEIKT
ncbi:MAG TPA: fatty acid desaturase [Candidatus Doudnabacteria bacterium]|nr:fatty acid desaturase [Candidatus Doudnabacteria bacterium]